MIRADETSQSIGVSFNVDNRLQELTSSDQVNVLNIV